MRAARQQHSAQDARLAQPRSSPAGGPGRKRRRRPAAAHLCTPCVDSHERRAVAVAQPPERGAQRKLVVRTRVRKTAALPFARPPPRQVMRSRWEILPPWPLFFVMNDTKRPGKFVYFCSAIWSRVPSSCFDIARFTSGLDAVQDPATHSPRNFPSMHRTSICMQ